MSFIDFFSKIGIIFAFLMNTRSNIRFVNLISEIVLNMNTTDVAARMHTM